MSETPSTNPKNETTSSRRQARVQDEPVHDPGSGTKTSGTLPVMDDSEK